ncbi:MAG: sigma-70 family RNA polymerase sigma factor [Flavisolibacter sp.]|nr:sigma-70 family RNA polymerase sigma factor [Flavisolibacter sp.]MBD0287607.1 sigma-70 family RNA polymerase sigma factor [Flavisolibacter sp.]MBD0295276.1 sigma-70 family RNA polymerase sigma factor [Flavisolibacter sp.]MBD0375545.1 sigma-70 family RNA polymerase sigma factor [Flavisolibacter sp.]
MEDLPIIVNGCINNEQKYQKMLYERYYGFAFKVVFRYIYRYEKVADVVNDGFVKVFRGFPSFICKTDGEVERSLMAWMKRIMVNTAIDELRKNHMMPEIGDISDHTWFEADKNQNADQQLLYKELMLQVKRLPPSYRTVFNLYVIDGYSHQEIAEQLGISIGTSKSNLFKAKSYLQNIINKDLQQADICNI